jgi:hypothetical protein
MDLSQSFCSGVILLMALLSWQQLNLVTFLDLVCFVAIGVFVAIWFIGVTVEVYNSIRYKEEEEDIE